MVTGNLGPSGLSGTCLSAAVLQPVHFSIGCVHNFTNALQLPFYMKNHSGMCAQVSAYACIASGHAAKSCTWAHYLLLHWCSHKSTKNKLSNLMCSTVKTCDDQEGNTMETNDLVLTVQRSYNKLLTLSFRGAKTSC